MTVIKKFCACRAWAAGSLVTYYGRTYRAARDAEKGERPADDGGAWQEVDLTRGAMTPPPNTMTAAPR